MTIFSELTKSPNLAPAVASTLDTLVDGGHVKSHAEAVEVLTLYGIMCANKSRIESGLPPRDQLIVRRQVQKTIAYTTLSELIARMHKSVDDHAQFLQSMRRK